MTASRRFFRIFLVALALGFAALRCASAADLDSYRAQGIIAEKYDGYVELKDNTAGADAKNLVDAVNKKRGDIYAQRAASQNVSVEDVGKIYAAQIFKEAPAGTYFKQPDGSYVKK